MPYSPKDLQDLTDPRHTALLVVDVQNDNSAPGGYQERHGRNISLAQEMMPRLARLLDVARNRGVFTVFFRNTQLRNGLSRSAIRARLLGRSLGGMPAEYELEGTWGHKVVDELAPRADELVIDKLRSSGFHGTSLDLILRSKGIENLVITGVVTEGCVESTVRAASWYDYLPIIVPDCVASLRRDLHEAALLVMCARYDAVMSDELIGAWQSNVSLS